MTTEIAQFMRGLEVMWDAHLESLLVRRDVESAVVNMVAAASVLHLPVSTGATGRPAVERFYAEQFVPHLPGDLARRRLSRTVDRFRLVDETAVSFVHDRELPWLLPGLEPTHCRAEVLTITVVSFDRGRMRDQRTLWDHATLIAQLGARPV